MPVPFEVSSLSIVQHFGASENCIHALYGCNAALLRMSSHGAGKKKRPEGRSLAA
jgi:hypothetical protein